MGTVHLGAVIDTVTVRWEAFAATSIKCSPEGVAVHSQSCTEDISDEGTLLVIR